MLIYSLRQLVKSIGHHVYLCVTPVPPRLGNTSDFEASTGGAVDGGSPTNQLLREYEMHLRNTLAKGMDAESYSLHTFEALLSQSMENLGTWCGPH